MKRRLVLLPLVAFLGLGFASCETKPETKKHQVTFDYDCSELSDRVVTVNDGDPVDRPADPTRDTHNFTDWYLGVAVYNFALPVNSNITITAHWTPKAATTTYNVTFNLNYEGAALLDPVVVNSGETVAKPVDPTRTTHNFTGWNLGSSAYVFSTPVTSNITLFAQWTEKPVESSVIATINFTKLSGKGAELAGDANKLAAFKTALGADSSKISSVTSTGGKIFDGEATPATSGLLKIGSGSVDDTRTAKITATFASSTQFNGAVIVARSWGGSSGNEIASLKVNSGAPQAIPAVFSANPPANPSTLTFTFASTNIIEFSTVGSNARSVFYSITLFAGDAPTPPEGDWAQAIQNMMIDQVGELIPYFDMGDEVEFSTLAHYVEDSEVPPGLVLEALTPPTTLAQIQAAVLSDYFVFDPDYSDITDPEDLYYAYYRESNIFDALLCVDISYYAPEDDPDTLVSVFIYLIQEEGDDPIEPPEGEWISPLKAAMMDELGHLIPFVPFEDYEWYYGDDYWPVFWGYEGYSYEIVIEAIDTLLTTSQIRSFLALGLTYAPDYSEPDEGLWSYDKAFGSDFLVVDFYSWVDDGVTYSILNCYMYID